MFIQRTLNFPLNTTLIKKKIIVIDHHLKKKAIDCQASYGMAGKL